MDAAGISESGRDGSGAEGYCPLSANIELQVVFISNMDFYLPECGDKNGGSVSGLRSMLVRFMDDTLYVGK
ncbi:hypothetical protein VN97_g2769 [Penicillium thymicola]|uniref:Uncharacterized protein n=1 Tax=Penicillium thymicola TaxID=293382 RepID=A0AAI9TP06_PENTH|nr:hypothetical protein VN97_g2769 [Penicillium thymicola]